MQTLPREKLSIGLIQMSSTDNVEQNVNAALAAMQKISNCDLICLPENALFLRLSKDAGGVTSFNLKESFWQRFGDFARERKTNILIGSIALQSGLEREGRKPTNSTIWINPQGEIRPVYDKIHLFDVDVKGAPPSHESDFFEFGERPAIIEIKGWKIGLSICYDVRFAELYNFYAQNGVHVVTVPAAFLVPTGEAHWHTLLRARAIESQCFVVAAAQSGGHRNADGHKRETFGHSMVVDPWGEILIDVATAGQAELAVDLDPERLARAWRQIPQRNHRRLVSR